MPLLLASTFQYFEGLERFVPSLSQWKVACITTAALSEIDDASNYPDWVMGEIDAVKNHAKEFFEYDLRHKNSDDLINDLSDCDLIYCIGGNTYCLLEAMNKSGYREFSKNHLAANKSIWGGSAGAIVNCPDIDYIAAMDKPEKANLESTTGLGHTNLYLVPHWNGDHHEEALQCLAQKPDLPILCLTDSQAIFMNDNQIEIL